MDPLPILIVECGLAASFALYMLLAVWRMHLNQLALDRAERFQKGIGS